MFFCSFFPEVERCEVFAHSIEEKVIHWNSAIRLGEPLMNCTSWRLVQVGVVNMNELPFKYNDKGKRYAIKPSNREMEIGRDE